MKEIDSLYDFEDILEKEKELIYKRRSKLGLEEDKELLGIALSGGGIRSATFNLGLLNAFNSRNLLKRSDYISSVSGGGYTHSFVQKELYEKDDFNALFSDDKINRLQRFGDYLRPYKGIRKAFESITFYLSFFVLAIMHLLWYLLLFVAIVIGVLLFFHTLPSVTPLGLSISLFILFSAFLWYYFLHPLRYYSKIWWNDRLLFYIFAIATILVVISYLSLKNIDLLPLYLQQYSDSASFIYLVLAITFLGYFSNPNILSMHRYYRLKITDAYLSGSNLKVVDLLTNSITNAPYPLICSTLNLQADKKIKGQKSCDYFLFSPLYSGSYLTGYAPSSSPLFKRVTLGTAVTISGAALNSMMGYKSNRFISFVLTLLNIRLGYWAVNPMLLKGERKIDRMGLFFLYNGLKALPTYWPFYNLAELFGKMNLSRWMVNLSDGGGIENLGAFELFNRRAKVIICSDVSADPNYEFEDLRNLLLRVRDKLEIAIEFEDNQRVEEIIKPKPSSGYSQGHYCIGRYYSLPESIDKEKKFLGYFIYIKASITAPQTKIIKKYRKKDYYGYKNNHPAFPHEPTTDQFFDEVQWKAYYKLGGEIGNNLLKEFRDCTKISLLQEDIENIIIRSRVCSLDKSY